MKARHIWKAVTVATLAAAAFVLPGQAAADGPPWGPETPPFNLEVILRDVSGGAGFGHVTFRQPNDADKIVYLDTWVRDLAPNHDYLLQRAADARDGVCAGANWLTLGAVSTDDRGTGRAPLSRNLSALQTGAQFDIEFRLLDAVTLAPVLASDCYRYTVSL
jgi:hypothetical protein